MLKTQTIETFWDLKAPCLPEDDGYQSSTSNADLFIKYSYDDV